MRPRARRKSNGLVRRAIKAWRRGDVVRAGAAGAARHRSGREPTRQAFHVLALALEKMGHLHKALVTYEQAFALDPGRSGSSAQSRPDGLEPEDESTARPTCSASSSAAARIRRSATTIWAASCAIWAIPSSAIETLRAAIYRMPKEAVLWNSLATVLAEEGRVEESLIFYQEAIALDPGFSRPWHNLGYAYSHLGRLDEALETYDEGLARAVDAADIREGRHSRSICLIGMGRLEEGFREYEIRNDPTFRAYVHHMVEAPLWRGEALDGKRILIVGEQGLGDEFMFANILPDVAKAVGPNGKMQIAVDPRLVPLFQRSFPDARGRRL